MTKTFLLVLCCAGCLIFLSRFLEPRLLYFPSKDMAALPSQYGLVYEDVFFNAEDGSRLHGWFVPAEGRGSGTILFCHGNAGNISHRVEKLVFFYRLGYDVFIFDYRGYGKSGGRPSEQGLYRDAEAAYHYLRARGISAEKIIAYGESIGGAVAAHLASRRPMKALVLENTFTNLKDMVRTHYAIIPTWLLSSRFDSAEKIASISIPKLILQSRNDEIVPPRLGAALFEAAAPPKEFLEIRGDHNNGFFESEDLIESKLRDFLHP